MYSRHTGSVTMMLVGSRGTEKANVLPSPISLLASYSQSCILHAKENEIVESIPHD